MYKYLIVILFYTILLFSLLSAQEDIIIEPEDYGDRLKIGYVWLPRQDQLQEMVKQKTLLMSLKHFCDWSLLQDEEFFKTQCDKVTSMEQLWLAFVMKEKYNKTWNGKEWIEND